MKQKKWRKPRAKKGELKCQWGKLRYSEPEIIYSFGEGVSGSDARLLHGTFNVEVFDKFADKLEPSFIDELKARGYDITTFKFSIQKMKSE